MSHPVWGGSCFVGVPFSLAPKGTAIAHRLPRFVGQKREAAAGVLREEVAALATAERVSHSHVPVGRDHPFWLKPHTTHRIESKHGIGYGNWLLSLHSILPSLGAARNPAYGCVRQGYPAGIVRMRRAAI